MSGMATQAVLLHRQLLAIGAEDREQRVGIGIGVRRALGERGGVEAQGLAAILAQNVGLVGVVLQFAVEVVHGAGIAGAVAVGPLAHFFVGIAGDQRAADVRDWRIDFGRVATVAGERITRKIYAAGITCYSQLNADR